MLLTLIAVGCQERATVPSTRVPTRIPPTPTPRSTTLPSAPNAPVLGEGERQIVIQFALFGNDAENDVQNVGNQLQKHFEEELALDILIEFVDESTVLKALCSGAPHAAWVSSFTYIAAQAKCEVIPVFAVKRGRAPRVTVGLTAEIIAQTSINTPSQLAGQIFCRSDEQDYFTSWVFPNLLLASQNINSATDLAGIQDYPSNQELGRALYEEECTAAALPPDEFEDFLIDLSGYLSSDEETVSSSDLSDVLHVLSPAGDTSFPANEQQWHGYRPNVIPYEVLVFPPESAIPAATREDIADAIADFFDDRSQGTQRLNDLLDASGLITVDQQSYQAFRSLIISAKWDMTTDY